MHSFVAVFPSFSSQIYLTYFQPSPLQIKGIHNTQILPSKVHRWMDMKNKCIKNYNIGNDKYIQVWIKSYNELPKPIIQLQQLSIHYQPHGSCAVCTSTNILHIAFLIGTFIEIILDLHKAIRNDTEQSVYSSTSFPQEEYLVKL